MTTTYHFEGIVRIVGSGLRGRRRAAARAHNARLRTMLRPRDSFGRFVPTGDPVTNASVLEALDDLEHEAWLESDVNSCPAGMVHIDQLEWEGGWVHGADGVTHAKSTCAKIHGPWFRSSDQTDRGWLCPVCIFVPVPVHILCHDIAPRIGSKVCAGCEDELKLTSFPTYVDPSGYRMRGDTCRRCERENRQSARMAA